MSDINTPQMSHSHEVHEKHVSYNLQTRRKFKQSYDNLSCAKNRRTISTINRHMNLNKHKRNLNKWYGLYDAQVRWAKLKYSRRRDVINAVASKSGGTFLIYPMPLIFRRKIHLPSRTHIIHSNSPVFFTCTFNHSIISIKFRIQKSDESKISLLLLYTIADA